MQTSESKSNGSGRKSRYVSRTFDRFLLMPVGRKIICLSTAYALIAAAVFLSVRSYENRHAAGQGGVASPVRDIHSGPPFIRDLLDGNALAEHPFPTLALVSLGVCGAIGWSFFTAFLIGMYNRRETNIRSGVSRYAPDWKRHGVILGWGAMGISVVKALRGKDYGCRDIVILSDHAAADIREELAVAFSANGADVPSWLYIYKGDCGSTDNLKELALDKAEQLLYIGDADGDASVQDSRAICALTSAAKLAAGRKAALPCHVCIRSVGLFSQLCCKDLPEEDAMAVDFRPFNPYVNWARKLWSRFSPDGRSYPALAHRPLTGGAVVHLFIIGFGDMGQALAAHAVKIAHYPGAVRLRVTVIDPLAEMLRDEFAAYLPLDRLADFSASFDFIAATAESPVARQRLLDAVADGNAIATVAICIPEPDAALETATRLPDAVKESDAPVLLRQRAPLSSDGSLFSTSLFTDLYVFGADTDCGLDPSIDRLAKAAHAQYLAQTRATGKYSPGSKPAHREWDRLPSIKRQSNRNQTDAIQERLAAWSYGWEKSEQADVPIQEADLEPMAEAEHRRWWAEYVLSGWKPGAEESALRRTHPSMVPYDQLDEGAKDYDRSVVRSLPTLLNKEYGVRLLKRAR